MCGRFVQKDPRQAHRSLQDMEMTGEGRPRFNVAPSQLAWAVRMHPQTLAWQMDQLRWGFCPTPVGRVRPINARIENVSANRMFRAAYAQRRCIVPADAFYEWQRQVAQGRGHPFAVVREDGAMLALAGLWTAWCDPAGDVQRSFALLTTAATGALAQIHARMPVLLGEGDWADWLMGGHPARPAEMALRVYAVGTAVNAVQNDSPTLLDPV